jgi:hypothetical protein
MHALIATGMLLPLLSAAGPKPSQRLTADGAQYPEAEPRRVEVDLPLVHKWLGGLPEEVTSTRIYSIDATVPIVKNWREKLVQHGIDDSDFQFITNGLAGSDTTLIGVSNGRVQRLGLFFPHLTPTRAQSILSPFEKTGTASKSGRNWFRISKAGIRFFGILAGTHKNYEATPHELKGWYFGASTSSGIKEDSYFSLITLGIHPVDWYVMHNKLSSEVSKAMLSGRLAKGMAEDEAILVLGKPSAKGTTERAGSERLFWRIPAMTETGGVSLTEVWAELSDGVVNTFEDVRASTDDQL